MRMYTLNYDILACDCPYMDQIQGILLSLRTSTIGFLTLSKFHNINIPIFLQVSKLN